MDKSEWEAYLENPFTVILKERIKGKHDEYMQAKSKLNPAAAEDAHKYFAASLALTVRAESYLAMHASYESDAFEDIFEEDT